MIKDGYYTLIIPHEVITYIEDSIRYYIPPYNNFSLDMLLDIITKLLSKFGFNIEYYNKYPYLQSWILDRLNNLLFYSTPTLHQAIVNFYNIANDKLIGIEVNINSSKYGDDYLISLYIIGDRNE